MLLILLSSKASKNREIFFKKIFRDGKPKNFKPFGKTLDRDVTSPTPQHVYVVCEWPHPQK